MTYVPFAVLTTPCQQYGNTDPWFTLASVEHVHRHEAIQATDLLKHTMQILALAQCCTMMAAINRPAMTDQP